jgi:hypothetical protein
LAIVSRSPSAVDSAAASPPAITRPVITNGNPAISGMASTTKSVLLTTKSAQWTMPSPALSTTSKRPAGCHSVTHRGKSATFEPTSLV